MKTALLAMSVLGASLAQAENLLYPVDVAVDGKGVVFVADLEAHAVLKLQEGVFQIVAKGKGLPRTPLYGIRHIAIDKEGRVVASDPATMKIYQINTSGGVTPVPDDDRWVTPWGVAVEPSGAILAVDRVTEKLRRVGPDGKIVDIATLHAPRAIVTDGKGEILVLTDKTILRVATDGKTTELLEKPPFQFPHDAVRHPDGNLYVSDGYAHAIWQVTPNGKDRKVTALVQGAPLISPQGMALDGKGNLLVADPKVRTVFVVTPKGEVTPLVK